MAGQRIAPRSKDVGLAVQHLADLTAAGGARQQVGRKGGGLAVVSLGAQPRFGGDIGVELVLHQGERVLPDSVVEADQDLSRLDDIAVAHQNLTNDAALEVLHRLARSVHHHGAGGDDGGAQRGQRRPQREATERQPDDRPAPADRPAIAHRKGRHGGGREVGSG